MSFLFKYLMIGLVISFLFESLIHNISGENFTFGERIWMIVLWPLAIIVFLMGLFKN